MHCLLNPNLQEPPTLLLQPVCPGVFYRAFELCYPQAKDLVRVSFPFCLLPPLPFHPPNSLCLSHGTCKGLLSRTLHSSHLGTGTFIFLTTLQVHPQCTLLQTPAGCSCLGNARCEGASRLCPLSLYAAHAEKALCGFWWLQASWSPSCH